MDSSTEESRFFDALEHIESQPDSISDFRNSEYEVWISPPQSVGERRKEFIRLMGFCSDELNKANSIDIERITENCGAVLRTSSIEDESTSTSSCNTVDLESTQGENSSQYQSSNIQFVPRENEIEPNCHTPRPMDKLRDKWLKKLRSATCLNRTNVKDDVGPENLDSSGPGPRARRVEARAHGRKVKELSALFTGQEIIAHEGAILSMKFSLDGQYLASAGEDGLVKVWLVTEDERLDEIDVPDLDPSCVYFSVNRLSELGPLMVEKDGVNKCKNLQRTQDSACVIFPPKVFRISEAPLHVFRGHGAEILDLSWSKNNCLLSSSVDKTVRLWRVGVDKCVQVFRHSDYVTCIQFNPMNDDYFISGSIDGKVRIWEVNECHVIDWIDSSDIITAISYRPDGKGGVFGTLTGTCHFFNISDNHFQLESELCLTTKKMASPCKRITGFQYLQQDPNKVLVTCADSQIRIIDGSSVISKYKGLRNSGNQLSASFTSDEKHIISTSEDSNVHIWNYHTQEGYSFFHPKKSVKSFEYFSSADATIAIPWYGMKTDDKSNSRIDSLPFTPSTRFLLNNDLFLESGPKGSATWPEEKLPRAPMGKSQYKFFKTSCQNSSNSHAWNLVIVTAGWDGRIRSFHNYGLPAPV